MRPPNDYVGEMIARHPIDDATVEALLAGRPVSEDLWPLAEVVQTYRRMASQPVRPSAALAQQIAAGVFTGAAESYQDLAARTGRAYRWRGRSLARTGWVAAVGGVAAAVAGVGTAGFAGVLPDQAQDRFESVVETVSPYEFPRPKQANESGDSGDACEPDRSICGEEVSEDATDGGVEGDEISERARERGDERRPVDPPTGAPEQPGPPSDVPAPAPGPPSDVPAPADPDPPIPTDRGPDNVPAPPANDRRPTAPPGRR